MRQIRLDRAHPKPKQYETTNGVLVRYKASLGYRKTIEHYADKIREGWGFEGNWFPHPRAKKLRLDPLDKRVEDLSKTREVYVGDIAFAPDGSIMEGRRVILTRPKIIEMPERKEQ